MDERDKFIKILIFLLIILLVIFALKITGVIKTDKKVEKVSTQNSIEIKNEILEEKTKKQKRDEFDDEIEDIDDIKTYIKYMTGFSAIIIFSRIIYIIYVIGLYKLYKKVGVNKKLNLINLIDSLAILILPFATMKIFSAMPSILISILYLIIILVIPIITRFNYYKATGSINSTVVMIFVFTLLLYIVPFINSIMAITCSITFIIVERISAFNLIRIYNKGTGYKVLAVLFPDLLLIILGFQKNEFETKHTFIKSM